MRLLILVVFFSALVGCGRVTPNHGGGPVQTEEYKRVNADFRREGFSKKDSDAAAKAVVKFNDSLRKGD